MDSTNLFLLQHSRALAGSPHGTLLGLTSMTAFRRCPMLPQGEAGVHRRWESRNWTVALRACHRDSFTSYGTCRRLPSPSLVTNYNVYQPRGCERFSIHSSSSHLMAVARPLFASKSRMCQWGLAIAGVARLWSSGRPVYPGRRSVGSTRIAGR